MLDQRRELADPNDLANLTGRRRAGRAALLFTILFRTIALTVTVTLFSIAVIVIVMMVVAVRTSGAFDLTVVVVMDELSD